MDFIDWPLYLLYLNLQMESILAMHFLFVRLYLHVGTSMSDSEYRICRGYARRSQHIFVPLR